MRVWFLVLAVLLFLVTRPVRADEAFKPDDRALAFPGIIGTARATAEICRISLSQYGEALQDAQTIAGARYQQIGLTVKDEQQNEDNAYHGYLQTHADVPSLPDCALFSRQIDNLYIWSAQQGAALVREGPQHP